MSPQQNQTALIERYSILPDPQERLAAIISRRPALPPVPLEQRTESHLVAGCQSRVWITGTVEAGRCHFQMEAESALVRGLVAMLCEICEGATPEEIDTQIFLEPELFETLGIARNLTPTRLNGLNAVRLHLREFARRHLSPDAP